MCLRDKHSLVYRCLADTLKGENLSKKAKEKRESLIKKIKDVKSV